MKKQLKRIMAIMVSLVMMLGCIPCNIVSAVEPITISEVYITSSGIFATNAQTFKYEVADEANYTLTDDPSSGWYNSGDYDIPYDFSNTGTAYKKLIIAPKSGYKFDAYTKVFLNDAMIIRDNGTIEDGKLIIPRENTVVTGTIYLDFEKPTTFSDFLVLKGDRTKFIMDGNEFDTEGGFDGIDVSEYSENLNDRGYFFLRFVYSFVNETELNKIKNFKYRDNWPCVNESMTSEQLLNMNVGDIYCYKENSDGFKIIVYEKIDFRKKATITCPTTAGTKVEEIKQSIADSFATTDSIGSIAEDGDHNKQIQMFDITNGEEDAIELDDDTYALENNKIYLVEIDINDEEAPAYSSIKVNDTTLTYTADDSDEQHNNHFRIDEDSDSLMFAFYKIDLRQPSGGSKKYKANDKEDTTEKITGTGKKGSKRTIIPEEGRKVTSVTVTDKNGNQVEVTPNEDGTFSFVQPASDVDIKVNYKNRLIKLTIGSLDASVDDVHHNLDVVPKIVNDRTMLPIRFVAENLGAKVDWDEKHPDTVIITRGNTKIEITLGSDKAKVNGEEYILDSVAFAENDRTYLPVRFVSEKLNAIVEWDESRPMDVIIYER